MRPLTVSGIIRTFCLILLLGGGNTVLWGRGQEHIREGWSLLVKDEEAQAWDQFTAALDAARASGDTLTRAEALLYLGICSYGSSYSNGLRYVTEAMKAYASLEKSRPQQAATGRGRCLQLVSTIYCRQKKYRESIALSLEARTLLPDGRDTSGTVGLIYSTLGTAYAYLDKADSSAYYHRLALEEHQRHYNTTYLPGAYLKVGYTLLDRQSAIARRYFEQAQALADSTANKQAMVTARLALAKGYSREGNPGAAERAVSEAAELASGLSDRSFYAAVLETYIEQCRAKGDYAAAFRYGETLKVLRDTLYNMEKAKVVKSLEASFRLSEKDRQLEVEQGAQRVVNLTHYLLWGGVGVLVLLLALIILFLKRVRRKDRQLLEAREALSGTTANLQKIKEQRMKDDGDETHQSRQPLN